MVILMVVSILAGLGVLLWLLEGRKYKKLKAKVERQRQENWAWDRQFRAAEKEGFYNF